MDHYLRIWIQKLHQLFHQVLAELNLDTNSDHIQDLRPGSILFHYLQV